MEFAEYGNLHESSGQHSIGRLCKFTIQAATALEHLEAKNVIHQVVKPFNCLVVAKDQVKVLLHLKAFKNRKKIRDFVWICGTPSGRIRDICMGICATFDRSQPET